MAILLTHVVAFLSLSAYAIYHLISALRHHHLLSPSPSSKPYYPLPLSPHRRHLLRHLPLYLLSLLLFLSLLESVFLSPSPPTSPVLHVTSLQTSVSLLLFLLLAISLLALTRLPSDLAFLFISLSFLLLFCSSRNAADSFRPTDLQSKSHYLFSLISASSSVFAISLAVNPFLFISEIALAGSVCLQGLWALQSGVLLYVDRFVPEGCHQMLEVAGWGEGVTRCELEESKVRALAVMDLAFVVNVAIVAVVVVVVCVGMERRGLRRNGSSYDALPTSSTAGNDVGDHVQMKAIGKNSMQE